MKNRKYYLSLLFALVVIFLFSGNTIRPETRTATAAVIQTSDIDRLLREAADLENKAARLRQAVENCRSRITPQSPDCQVYIEWQKAVVSYKEAERIAQTLEDQAREKRRQAENLQSQQTPPPVSNPEPQPVSPAAPPAVVNQPASGNQTQGTGIKPTNQPPSQQQPASVLPRPDEVTTGGLTQKEWANLRNYQQEIDELYSRIPLSDEDAQRFFELLQARNALWQKAISVPGLTPEERQRLRLLIHTRSQTADVPAFRKEEVMAPSKKREKSPPPPFPVGVLGDIVEAHVETGTQQAIDEFGKKMTETINLDQVDRGLLTCENVVGVSKISLKLKQKDVPGAISETVDFVLGKVITPLSSMNINVFKSAYSRITFGAVNKFFDEVNNLMKANGGSEVKFNWEEFHKDMSTGQKAVAEWIGYGDLIKDKIKEDKQEDK